jgi:hypothetical protein
MKPPSKPSSPEPSEERRQKEIMRGHALLNSREKSCEKLRQDDPSAPELTSLRAALLPMWRDIPPLVALFTDPRWTELEKTFSQGQAALRAFAPLGPLHAGLARRFGRLVGYIFGGWYSWDLLPFSADSSENEAADFFAEAPEKLHWAAERTATLNGRLTGEVRNREAEEALIESYGVSPAIFRATTKQVRRDLHKLAVLVWQQIESAQPRPNLLFSDRFMLPGMSPGDPYVGSVLAIYQHFRHRRIVFSLPVINNLISGGTHLLPEIPQGLSLAELINWEPCNIGAPKTDYVLSDIVIHELTHALSAESVELLTPTSLYWTGYERFCREKEIKMPRAFTRVGLAQIGEDDSMQVCLGLGLFNEVLTEAAALEIRKRIDQQIPASLKAIGQTGRVENSVKQPYREGLDLLTEFLPGLSPLTVITGENPAAQLVTGIRKRLSLKGAQKVLKILFESDFSELAQAISQAGFSDEGEYVGLWCLLRQMVVEDDAARAIK